MLLRYIHFANNLNEKIGRATAWLTAALVLLVCFDVVARKLFHFSRTWIMELEWHIFALIFLLSSGYALRHNRHVRVDLFYEKFSARDKALTNFVGHLLFLIPWCVMVFIVSYHYGMESLSIREGSAEPGGLPARYLIKFCITASVLLLLLQAIADLLVAGQTLFGKNKNGENAIDTKPNP